MIVLLPNYFYMFSFYNIYFLLIGLTLYYLLKNFQKKFFLAKDIRFQLFCLKSTIFDGQR